MPKLNPDIREMEIGVSELRTVTIYPLSVKDQKDLTDLVKKALDQFATLSDLSGDDEKSMIVQMSAFVLNFIEDNIEKVVRMVLPKENDALADITNNQLVSLVETLYEVNYRFLSGKVKTLIEKATKTEPMENGIPLSQKSVETTATH